MNSYFEIEILRKSNSYSREVSKILSALHGATRCYEQSPIAIGFPRWRHHKEARLASFGKIVRFFGDAADLGVWYTHPTIEKLEEAGIIEVGKIQRVPDDCDHVRYVRDRTIERLSRWRKYEEPLAYPPSALLKSGENGQKYPIRVRMEKVDGPMSGGFNAFGLSNGDNPGSVPFF